MKRGAIGYAVRAVSQERRNTVTYADRDAVAARVVQDVAELPDRTSPDDWPEAMLVTADELTAIVERALQDFGR